MTNAPEHCGPPFDEDQYMMLVNSVCDIDAWSKQGTINELTRDKIQMVCSAFYMLAKEYTALETEHGALREAISPGRQNVHLDYYIAVAAKLRESQLRIKLK